MRLQEEQNTPPDTATEPTAGQFPNQRPDAGSAFINNPLLQAPAVRGSIELLPTFPDEGLPSGLPDDHIRAILRSMSLGHFIIGMALMLGGVIVELVTGEPAFFGLAASGGMLCACGLMTMLGNNRQRASQSPLAFYLLPYADFAIVGLWMLLFGATGPIILFYPYVVVSAALLLGSRHAIALTGLAGAAILAVSLGQQQEQGIPAIHLSADGQTTLTILATTLALALIVYVARLFSLDLDRFIALTNRQRDHLFFARRRVAEQQEQARDTMEQLSSAYMRFKSGDTDARAPVPSTDSPLAFAPQLLNALLDHQARQSRAWAAHARLEERISELSYRLDRLSNGDATALQNVTGPTGTSLDTLMLALARIGQQLLSSQQALKQALGGYSAVMGIAADLSILQQSLSSADSSLYDLQRRSAQSVDQLRARLESGEYLALNRSADRLSLHEMELRAQEQSSGLDLLRARLGHIGAQIEVCENELRRITESMEQVARVSRPLSATPVSAPADVAALNAPIRPARDASQPSDGSSPQTPTPPRAFPRIPRPADPLPRRFTGPLSAGRSQPERPDRWPEPPAPPEYELNSSQQEHP
ncbi:MAG TPA: hypothetical protein VH590_01970 [Ktedonobacterales bacterium]|jgi:hypothetical protein